MDSSSATTNPVQQQKPGCCDVIISTTKQLVESWGDDDANNNKTNNKHTKHNNSITSLELYHLGCILQSFYSSSDLHQSYGQYLKLQESYQQLLREMPVSYRQPIFQDLFNSLLKMIDDDIDTDNENEQLTNTFEAVSQLYVSALVDDFVSSSSSTSSPPDDDANTDGLLEITSVTKRNFVAEVTTVWTSSSSNGNGWNDNNDRNWKRMIEMAAASTANKRLKDSIVAIVSNLLWFSTSSSNSSSSSSNGNDHFEKLLETIHLLQGCGLWSDVIKFQQKHLGQDEWKDVLLDRYNDDKAQRDYLGSFLEYHEPIASSADDKTEARLLLPDDEDDNKKRKPKQKPLHKPADEVGRRIEQVQQLLPDLGAGYVEAALSCYDGNVEQTVAALFDDVSQLPTSLQILDRSLPRRKQKQTGDEDDEEQEEEARKVAKSKVLEAERLEKEEADMVNWVMQYHADADDGEDDGYADHESNIARRLNSEYDDDYDDQYDEMIDVVGSADTGLYDRDDDVDDGDDKYTYRAIKMYNKMVKETQEEEAYWLENQNFNRFSQDTNAPGRKLFRGPDKLKGGRTPNTGDGGRGRGRGSSGRGGGGRGRGGGRGKGEGRGGGGQSDNNNNNNDTSTASAGGGRVGRGRGGGRKKANKMANRREKQKQAAAKKGAG